MYASKIGAIDVDSLATHWGPRLVRFYFFMCADKSIAEASAIETLAEAVRTRESSGDPSALIRLAVIKGVSLHCGIPNGDLLSRSVALLAVRQRLAIALVHGMGIPVNALAQAIDISLSESKRLIAEAFLELHRLRLKNQVTNSENSSET